MQPPSDVASSSDRQKSEKAIVIGLGGGALPAYLRHYIQLNVLAVELDPVIYSIAQEHFGFETDEHLQVGLCLILTQTQALQCGCACWKCQSFLLWFQRADASLNAGKRAP